MSRHDARQKLARKFGATDIATERGDAGIARIKELTRGIGADSVLEFVGTQQSMMQAIGSAPQGSYVSYVGVPHGVTLDGVLSRISNDVIMLRRDSRSSVFHRAGCDEQRVPRKYSCRELPADERLPFWVGSGMMRACFRSC
jgi:threonine dehydrogenase-like Zn-dependent dehydrogenase